MNNDVKDKDIDVVKSASVFKLAWPIFIQTFLAMCLGYVDSLMLGRYSQNAVGAIGNATQIIGILSLVFIIISSATGVIVSQYLGAKLKEKLNSIYTVSVFFNLAISLIISMIIIFFSGFVLHLMKIPSVMFYDANIYMKIVGGFIFTEAIYDVFAQIFRSNGNTVIGMIISFVMNIINVIGDYLVLYGPLKFLNLGIKGVALATALSKITGLIIAIVFFVRCIKGHISIKYIRPFPKEILKQLLKLGVPTAGENISYYCSQMIVTVFVNMLGACAITTKVYGGILSNFSYLYSMSVGMALSIIVGHAIGDKDEEFAYKKVLKTLRYAMIISSAIAVINFILSRFTFAIFTDSKEIIDLGQKIMFIAVLLELGRTCNLIILNSMKAAGDVKFPTFLGIAAQWTFSVGVGYILGIYFKLGLIGIWIGMALDEIVRGIVVLIRWKLGGWRNKGVIVTNT